MTSNWVLLVAAMCTVEFIFLSADDACQINKCKCGRNAHAPYNDVSCFLNSITPSDDTIQALPPDVQSLILSCSSRGSYSFFSAGIFEKFPNLTSLAVEDCNIITLSAESFKGLISLRNLSISKSPLPPLRQNTFMYLSNLRHLSVVNCNMTTFPDISHMQALQYLNISHNKLRHMEIASPNSSGRRTTLSERDSSDGSERNDLGDLRIIDLSFNNLNETPVGLIERTPHVQELYLMGLSLTRLLIPQEIRLNDLIVLDATQNRLQDVDFQSLRLATHMKELRLGGAGQTLSCRGLSYLVNLEELSLNNFGLTDAVWQELNSTMLARLNLSNNSLSTVDIHALPNVRVLHLANNRISFVSNLTFINQPGLLLVNLSQNKLQSLPVDLFRNNFQLKAIDLHSNYLERLEKATFRALYELFYLDLKHNMLSYLPYAIFENLFSMSYLYLSGNRLSYLPKLSYMSGLYHLDISNNQLFEIHSHQLAGLDKLEILLVNDNNLTILPPNLLAPCPNLLQVYLHKNQITDMGSLGNHPRLAVLRLDNNKLTDFVAESPFIHLRNLQYLFLDSNNFTRLKANTFPPSIVTLLLDDNSIKVIDVGTFAGLNRLSYVSLRSNKVFLFLPLTVVNVFRMLSPKPTFNVERNVFYCDCHLGYLKAISEDVNSVYVFKVYYPLFVGFENALCYTPYWGESFRPFTEVPLSQFVCEYKDSWCDFLCNCCSLNTSCDCLLTCPGECECTHGGSGFTRSYFTSQCSSKHLDQVPAGLTSRTMILYLDGNNLSYLSQENFTHLPTAEEIYLNNSAIESIHTGTFDNITTLKLLFLNDNLLKTIPEHLFGNLSQLKELYLHNNLITSISPVAFSSLPSVERITLHNNKLVLLNTMLQLPPQLTLTLSGNPWSCDCEVSKFTIRAVYDMSRVTEDVQKMCCIFYNDSLRGFFDTGGHINSRPGGDDNTGDSTQVAHGSLAQSRTVNSSSFEQPCFPLLSFKYEEYCIPMVLNSTLLMPLASAGLHPGIIALIVIIVVVILTASSVVLILWKRQEIQALVFVKFGVRVVDKKAQLDKAEGASKVFDAFISHSSKDAELVATILAPALEHGDRKYRLCVHYRDFPVGRNITDTICRAIENSSRTILLLSVHFLSSEWCRFEFQTAHHHILSQGNHRLIIVVLEDIPEHMLDPDLKVHMKSNTYLRFGDRWFWEKLYFAMPTIKDRRGDNDNQQMDMLRGMKLLAGDDDAADQPNCQNEDNEIRREYGNQALNIFNQLQGNEMRCLQGHENWTEEMNSNCHGKPAENHVIMEVHKMDAIIKEADVNVILDDTAVTPGNRNSVEYADSRTQVETRNGRTDQIFHPGNKYLHQVSDYLNNQKDYVDDNIGDFHERKRVSVSSSVSCSNREISREIKDETQDANMNLGAAMTWRMSDKDRDACNDNNNSERIDSGCRDNALCDLDDAEQTCAYTVYDARMHSNSVTIDS